MACLPLKLVFRLDKVIDRSTIFTMPLGKTWNGMEWNGMDWNGMEWNGMEWIGLEWNGMEFYSIMSS